MNEHLPLYLAPDRLQVDRRVYGLKSEVFYDSRQEAILSEDAFEYMGMEPPKQECECCNETRATCYEDFAHCEGCDIYLCKDCLQPNGYCPACEHGFAEQSASDEHDYIWWRNYA